MTKPETQDETNERRAKELVGCVMKGACVDCVSITYCSAYKSAQAIAESDKEAGYPEPTCLVVNGLEHTKDGWGCRWKRKAEEATPEGWALVPVEWIKRDKPGYSVADKEAWQKIAAAQESP